LRIGEGMPEEQYNQASCMKRVAAGYIGIGDHDEAVRLIKRALDLPAVARDAHFSILTILAFIESYPTSQVSPPQDKLEAIREVLMDGHL
jgi:hypothetical protein